MKVVVNAIIKNQTEDRFLIIKRKRGDKIHSGKWAFPGGLVKRGEDLIEALKREIKEETGLRIKNNFKKISEYGYKRPNNEVTFGICFSCTSYGDDIISDKEIADFAWIKPYELSKYKHIKELNKEILKAFRK